MIKYTIFPEQPEEDVAITREVFSELERRSFPGLPVLQKEEKALMYVYADGIMDSIAVYFKSTGDHTGFFYKRIPDSSGSYQIESAEFQYDE